VANPRTTVSSAIVSAAEIRFSSARMSSAANLSSVRSERCRRNRPSSTAATKTSTIDAAVSIATWKRRLPIVGSIGGTMLTSSVRARHALAASDAAYRAFAAAARRSLRIPPWGVKLCSVRPLVAVSREPNLGPVAPQGA
jgi:hypothetical protein